MPMKTGNDRLAAPVSAQCQLVWRHPFGNASGGTRFATRAPHRLAAPIAQREPSGGTRAVWRKTVWRHALRTKRELQGKTTVFSIAHA
jgi:hypothetical protein